MKSERPFRLRLAWIFILGTVSIFIFGAINEYIELTRDIATLRQALESAEIEKSYLVVDAVRPALERGDWQAAQAVVDQMSGRTPGLERVLTDGSGMIYTPDGGVEPLQLLDQTVIQAAAAGQAQITWIEPDHRLRVLAPVISEQGRLLAVLVSDSDNTRYFSNLHAEKNIYSVYYFLFLLLASGIYVFACWRLFIIPLNEIYRLSRAITQGKREARVSDIFVLELQRVIHAFNEMVQYLSAQQTQLEETVAERTRALEESSAEIRSHNLLMGKLIAQSEHLNRTVTPEEVIDTIGKGTLALCTAAHLAIFIDDLRDGVKCAWSHGLPEYVIEAGLPWVNQILNYSGSLDARPILIADTSEMENHRARKLAQAYGIHAASLWPLVYEGKVIALVCCLYDHIMEWKGIRLEILEAFFRQAVVSLENARLFQAEYTQRKLAEALRDAAAILTSTLDLDEVLEVIIENLGRVVPHDAAGVMLLEGEMIRPVRWQGVPPESSERFKNWQYPLSSLRNRQLMKETGQAIVIPDTSKNPHWVRTQGLEWVQSYAGAPICQRGKLIGFIDVMSARPGFYHPNIGPILLAFALQAAIAMENARLYQQSQQRNAETTALFRAVQPLFKPAGDIFALAQEITESVTQEFASAHCSLLLVNKEHTHIVLMAQSGSLILKFPELPLDGPGLTVAAANSGQVIYAPDVTLIDNYVAGADLSRCELVIPLLAGGQVIGVLNLESTEVDAFDERARRLMATFAERTALGLENAQLFETIRQNAEELARLSKVAEHRAQEAETLRLAASSVNSTLELQAVLDLILKQLDQVIPHDSACIFLIEGEQSVRAGAVKSVARAAEVFHQSFPRNDALLMEIERTGRPVILQDAQQDPRFHGWGGTSSVHGWVGIPLFAANEFVGALTLDRYAQDIFQPDEIELAQAFAIQAAAAVQNARLYHAAQQRARELEALHAATKTLVSTLDQQKLLERILAAATSAIPAAEKAAVHLLDENQRLSLQIKQVIGSDQVACQNWNDEESPWAWVIKHLQPVLITPGGKQTEEHGEIRRWPCFDNRSWLIAPLMLETKALGTITLVSTAGSSFSEQEMHLLTSFANTATAALHNAKLHSDVQYLAITDPLTGLYNRRGFFERAQQVIDRAAQNEEPVAAVMIDIDYFKRINDNYGHDAGDAVLRTLADRCRASLGEFDLICRYGGEEFAVLMPKSEYSGALDAANKLFNDITGSPMQIPSGAVTVTISVGVATFGGPCNTLDHLLKCADQALYQAKGKGRNQVCVWN